MNKKISLNWQTFQKHTKDLLTDLHTSSKYSDVTLVCDDKTQFKAHKFVLSSCSAVFEDILSSNVNWPVIYLRGILKEEMEAVLQFMYLGEATVYQDRMNEFLNVARDLNLKDIGKNIDITDDLKQPLGQSSFLNSTDYQSVGDEDGKYQCPQCDYKTSKMWHLKPHIKSMHEGIKYPCQQCDYQSSDLSNLRQHIKVVHEGLRFTCPELNCDYKTTRSNILKYHLQIKH